MAKTWKEVRAQAIADGTLTEARIGAAREQTLARMRAYRLAELRAAAGLNQNDVALQLGVSQGRVSVIESSELERTELATLKRYAAAIGGELEVIVKLGDERHTLA